MRSFISLITRKNYEPLHGPRNSAGHWKHEIYSILSVTLLTAQERRTLPARQGHTRFVLVNTRTVQWLWKAGFAASRV